MGSMKAKEVKEGDIVPEDIVVALMGPTGTGKSTFIDTATSQKQQTAGHSLKSYTSEIRAVRLAHPSTGKSYVLVDTPGFDDTKRSDMEVLSMIADWLKKTYKNQLKLSGIVYLHRISDNRMSGSPLKNLRMFTKLCGDGAVKHVVLGTTMWNRVKKDVGERREQELKGNYWRTMLHMGSTTMPFNGTVDSAWDIIDRAVAGDSLVLPLLLQEELVDLDRHLGETEAGKTLYTTLQKLLVEQKRTIKKLRNEANAEENEQLSQELARQYEDVEKSLQRTFDQIEKMKIPFSRRFRMLFSFKRAKSGVINIE